MSPVRFSPFRFHRPSGLAFELLEDRLAPAVVIWDGGGGDFNWNNPLNWSGDQTPTVADVAIINDAGITVSKAGTNTTIQSIQSAASLSVIGGSLTVTSGLSQIDGSLSVDGATITVRGAGATFTANAAVTLDGASLFAGEGGRSLWRGRRVIPDAPPRPSSRFRTAA